MDYIVCRRRKSRPKTSVTVCERCSRKGACQDYRTYLQPPLFPKLKRQEGEKKPQRRSARTHKGGSSQKQEQTAFALS